jgi:hypothetical protein
VIIEHRHSPEKRLDQATKWGVARFWSSRIAAHVLKRGSAARELSH